MSLWVQENKIGSKVSVFSVLPEKGSSGFPNAVVVVNSTKDHEKAIEWAISNHLPVLAEKPMTLSFESTYRLIRLANEKKVHLAAAHVFRFARYLENFSELLKNRTVQSVRITWMDSCAETRYGEAKKYDSSLPIYKDLLPHICSILSVLGFPLPEKPDSIELLRGGAYLKISFHQGSISIDVELQRDGDKRRRLIEVETNSGKLFLDFSTEPGFIYDGTKKIDADPEWNSGKRPIARMLTAFLEWIAHDVYDNRLDGELGLKASELMETVEKKYDPEMKKWLNQEFSKYSGGEITEDLRYALTEIFQTKPDTGDIVKAIEEYKNKLDLK